MSSPTPTLRQIAAAAGVHNSTVSRALANRESITKAERIRIQEIAHSMGWRPNPMASAYMAHLRSTRPSAYQATLGFLVMNAETWDKLPGHSLLQFTAARERAAQYGYELEPMLLFEKGMTPRRMHSILQSRNIPGLIVSGFDRPGESFLDFNWKDYATVCMGFALKEPVLHRVSVNIHRGFLMMIKRAFELGYRRVAVVTSKHYDEKVEFGVLFPVHYMEKNLEPGQSLRHLVIPRHHEDEIEKIKDWLQRYRPDLVIGMNLASRAIRDLGWKIPQDVAYMTHDISHGYEFHAGFDQRHDKYGSIGVDILAAQLAHNERGIPETPLLHLFDGELKEGTTAPRKKKERSGSRKAAP